MARIWYTFIYDQKFFLFFFENFTLILEEILNKHTYVHRLKDA